jgi:endonuclease-8
MPEGDTVWLTAQRLNKALAGRRLTLCDLRVPALATVDLAGQTVLEVLARGKHLLVRLDSRLSLHSHLRMDGSWYLCRAGERPRGHPDHLIRAQLGNAQWLATGYRVHDLEVVRTADESHLVGHLGPDLLGPDWDPNEAVRRLAALGDRPIAEALLDQRNLAGIGNLYKSEVLFLDAVNPHRRVADVDDLAAIVETAHRLLQLNRERPEQSTTGRLGRGQQHWVYERGGKACLRCGTAIRRELLGEPGRQRSTYWCPTCQPE